MLKLDLALSKNNTFESSYFKAIVTMGNIMMALYKEQVKRFCRKENLRHVYIYIYIYIYIYMANACI